jgi:Asp-tRNA(Asn)/Glu-tRNA(Gln) amidotransferase A subunit family amidase
MTTPAERLAVARARIAERADLHAFISLSQEQFEGSQAGPIVAVKDLIDVRGLPTTAGSVRHMSPPATVDALVVRNVRAGGGVVIGKTNLYEWAFGVTAHNPHYGDIVNPWDHERMAGGSSGGSAAAVAAGMCDWAIGTDTGGSIRIPASLCGVVGFKPTRGLLSTEGVLALSHTLDTVGPLARDVAGAVSALEQLHGAPLSQAAPMEGRPRVAVPRGWVRARELDEPTRAVWESVSRSLEETDFPALERMSKTARTVLEWDAAVLHEAALARDPQDYGQEVRERLRGAIEWRRGSDERVYTSALSEMSELTGAAEHVLRSWDALVLPATACVAPRLSERDVREPLVRFMRPFNLTGHPAIVLPAPSAGLPVGIQLVGRLGGEAALAAVALSLEREWAGRNPSVEA